MQPDTSVGRLALILLIYLATGFLVAWLLFVELGIAWAGITARAGAGSVEWASYAAVAKPAAVFGLPIAFVVALPAMFMHHVEGQGAATLIYVVEAVLTAVVLVPLCALLVFMPRVAVAAGVVAMLLVLQLPFLLAGRLMHRFNCA